MAIYFDNSNVASGLNEITTNTLTTLSGILKGASNSVAVAEAGIDYAAADHTHTPESIGAISVESFDGFANYVDNFISNYPDYITPEGIGAAAASIGISATLLSSGWSSNAQTIIIDGVTVSNNVVVAPVPANMQEYIDCAVYCSAQAANQLTFNCTSVPSADITVNVLIVG